MEIRLRLCSHCSTGGRKSKGETCKQMIALRFSGFLFQLPQQLLILFGGQIQLGIEIRAALTGAEDGLLAPPPGDVFVVAGAEDGGNLPAVPLLGAGVLGVLQQAVPVALLLEALRVGEHPGYQPCHRVGHHHGGQLAASLSEGREEKEVVYLGKKPYTLHLHFESPLQHRHCFILLTPIAASSSEKRCSHGVKKNSLPAKYHFSDILGHSPAVQKAIRLAQYYSGTDETILIFGESGTGKELFAQSIHNASRRRQSPFVAVNCAAIPDTLIESELFGYEEGAFTGARKGGKQGLFQTADNGTIFLDEIGDIPLSLQSRLLRVLEEREVMPVGSTSVIPIDVRVICATNRNLNEMVRQGTFREDLYYRLKILPLVIPPLRERVEDIPELLHSMAEGARLPAQLEHRLLHYTWPGNVRELRAFSSNLTIFYQQDIAPDQQQSLLNDLIRNFFGHRISAFTDCSEPLSQEDRLLLNSIQELTAAGRPAGRGSLLRLSPLLAAGFTEAKLKLRIRRLAESGYISVGKTRQGLRLTLLGTEALAQGEV